MTSTEVLYDSFGSCLSFVRYMDERNFIQVMSLYD